ncbi:unnamed protein product [Prorocentrum cordatum]|uniref:Type II protein arginine methyltransferase n=1 Tax=Prorocentrum cordatum TaxID=2364126 RepID=A0ABN9S9W8_9DINO|nr:unnamed protein product [Polarella glacialis]
MADFGVAPSDDDLGEALKKNNWKLMSAWGLAVLDHLQDADGPNDVPTADTGNRDRDGLLQTLSTIQRPGMSCTAHELMSTWSPRLLRYFEEYAEQPAYSAFTPSLRRHGSFDNFEVLGQAHEVNPSLVMLLHDTVEPSAGTPWRAEVERQGPGGPILSQAYVFSVFVLANMYSDMMKSAWEFGSTDLEVFEVGGGSGGLAWLAAHLSAFSPDHPELGFRTWTIFDIPHVAALQMWYLNKTLPVSCTLERICGAGLSAGSSTGAALELSPPPAGGGLVRLVDTSAREFWLYGQRMYDRSDPARSARRRVRVLVASWSWSETDASEFLWYANHVLSLCDFAIYTYSTWWDQNSTTRWKLDVITEQMEPMLGIVIQNGNEITKLFRRRE